VTPEKRTRSEWPHPSGGVGKDGRVLYVNSAYAAATSIEPGMTLHDIVERCEVRTFDGERLTVAHLPESYVLRGEQVAGTPVRIRPAGAHAKSSCRSMVAPYATSRAGPSLP
jgi:hypothetical protein